MDITQLILDDHHEQRRLFAILEQIDRAETGVLSAVWGRLASFLELHAAAEEEIFAPGRAEPVAPSCVIVGSRWACQQDAAPPTGPVSGRNIGHHRTDP